MLAKLHHTSLSFLGAILFRSIYIHCHYCSDFLAMILLSFSFSYLFDYSVWLFRLQSSSCPPVFIWQVLKEIYPSYIQPMTQIAGIMTEQYLGTCQVNEQKAARQSYGTWLISDTVEPPIKDPPRYGQPPNKGSGPISHSNITSEKRTTSQLRTKWLVPTCPLFGGSTVEK